jgi:hypothetical protein
VEAAITRRSDWLTAAVETRIEARLALGDGPDLVAELEALVARHPLSERLRRHLMVALYASGRQADALAAFQSYRTFIADELGLEPSPELQRVEWEILTHRLRSPTREAGWKPPTARLNEELGVPATGMIGRTEVVGQVLDRLSEARLVALAGPVTIGDHEPAAVLLGALRTSPTAPAVSGADRERLAEADRAIAVHGSTEDARAWEEQGRAMDDPEAIAYATAAVDRVLRRSGVG